VEPVRLRRPLERRLLAWAEAGREPADMAARLRRSPEHLDRVLELARLPRPEGAEPQPHALRPLERRIMRWRGAGASFEDIAARFRRSPAHVERIVGLAQLKADRAS